MNAGEARSIAERWLSEEVARSPGVVECAFTAGTINELADADPFPPASDVDLWLVVPQVDPERHRVVKHSCGGLAVESGYFARERFRSPEAVLSDYALAQNVIHGKVLYDPDGTLEGLRAAIAPEFSRRRWVRQRCRSLCDEALRFIAWAEASDRFLFVNAVAFRTVQSMAQMALVADLRNPTVKKALVKARQVFARYGLDQEHRGLLRLLGAAELGDEAVLAAAGRCGKALGEACRWRRTPFGADNQVTEHSRPSLDLEVPACVAEGAGREMFLWVATLHSLAMMALHNDAPAPVEVAAWYAYLDDMALVGLTTMDAARARVAAGRSALAPMIEVCDGIVARNPRAVE